MLTGAPTMFCFKHGGSRVKVSLWPFCEGFQDIPRQFRHVLTSKDFNRCDILLVGLGGPTYVIKWESGEFSARVMADLPRILFGHQDKLRYARLAFKKWLKHGQQKT